MCLCKDFGADLTLRWNKPELIIELGNELWFILNVLKWFIARPAAEL
jgi:hypothetical protein